jgi:hypothetical protein
MSREQHMTRLGGLCRLADCVINQNKPERAKDNFIIARRPAGRSATVCSEAAFHRSWPLLERRFVAATARHLLFWLALFDT